VAVDIGKTRQVFVETGLTRLLRRVENLEEPAKARADIRILRRAFEPVPQQVFRLEDAGVICEEAEDDAGEENLQLVAGIAGAFQFVMQGANQFGGLDVDRFLILETAGLAAEDEGKFLGQKRSMNPCEPPSFSTECS
jgi:hypothetical protein